MSVCVQGPLPIDFSHSPTNPGVKISRNRNPLSVLNSCEICKNILQLKDRGSRLCIGPLGTSLGTFPGMLLPAHNILSWEQDRGTCSLDQCLQPYLPHIVSQDWGTCSLDMGTRVGNMFLGPMLGQDWGTCSLDMETQGWGTWMMLTNLTRGLTFLKLSLLVPFECCICMGCCYEMCTL